MSLETLNLVYGNVRVAFWAFQVVPSGVKRKRGLRTIEINTLMMTFGCHYIIQIAFLQEEPRIREQDFGNYQTQAMAEIKKERLRFGRFFYRFPNGESGADVYDRVSSFFETLFRQFKRSPISDIGGDEDYVLLIVSHGLTIRLFVMKFLGFDVSYFEKLRNPRNCTPIVMRRKVGTFVYELEPNSWRSMGVLNASEQCIPVNSFQFPVHYCVSASLHNFKREHKRAFADLEYTAGDAAQDPQPNQ